MGGQAVKVGWGLLTWLNNVGILDPERSRILKGCIKDLDRVLPEITDPAGTEYFERLRRLALVVSATLVGAE